MDDAITFTSHALQRMNQRGLSTDMIIHAMTYGRIFHRQGYVFHCVASKDLPERMNPTLVDRLRNLVVVCKDGDVITTYRNGMSFSKVRKNSTRLRRM